MSNDKGNNALFELVSMDHIFEFDEKLDNNQCLSDKDEAKLRWIQSHPMADDIIKEMCLGLFNKNKYLEQNGSVDTNLSLKDYVVMKI